MIYILFTLLDFLFLQKNYFVSSMSQVTCCGIVSLKKLLELFSLCEHLASCRSCLSHLVIITSQFYMVD